jgi:hypothetical protein
MNAQPRIYKNVTGQYVTVFAWDLYTETAKTGNAASITAVISKDCGAFSATNDVNPTEVDVAGTPKGFYQFELSQAETNADHIIFVPVSATAGVKLKALDFDTVFVKQTGDSYAVVAHADYGNAKLVRSTTPANTLTVHNTDHGVLVSGTKQTLDELQDLAAGAAMTLTGAYDAAKTAAQAGAQMDLVNAPNATAVSAIAASVWSYLVAAMTTPLSIGEKLARLLVSAPGQVTNTPNAAGSDACSWTVETSGGVPIQGATVYVSVSSTGTPLLESEVSNAFGEVTFTLTDGATYYRMTQASGYEDGTWESFVAVKDA